MSAPYSLSFHCPHCSMDHTVIPCSLEPSTRLLVCSLICRVNGAACAFRPGTLHQTVRIPIARLFSFFKPLKKQPAQRGKLCQRERQYCPISKGPLARKRQKGSTLAVSTPQRSGHRYPPHHSGRPSCAYTVLRPFSIPTSQLTAPVINCLYFASSPSPRQFSRKYLAATSFAASKLLHEPTTTVSSFEYRFSVRHTMWYIVLASCACAMAAVALCEYTASLRAFGYVLTSPGMGLRGRFGRGAADCRRGGGFGCTL